MNVKNIDAPSQSHLGAAAFGTSPSKDIRNYEFLVKCSQFVGGTGIL